MEGVAAILASSSVWSRQQVVALTSTCTALWEVRETFFRSLHSKIAAPSRPYVSIYSKNYYNGDDHEVEKPEEYMYKKKYAHMCFERGMQSMRRFEEMCRGFVSIRQTSDEEACNAAYAVELEALKLLRIASNLAHGGASITLELQKCAKRLGVKDLLLIENPSAIVQNMIGDYYYALDNYDKAIKYYRPSAERGFHSSQYSYGNMLGWGEACETNEELAYEYHNLAASQGNSLAVERLSVHTRQGWGMEKSASEATRLMLVAAKMGNPAAMEKYASLLLENSGAKTEDYYQAFLFFSRGAALGSKEALKRRTRMLHEIPSLCLPLGAPRNIWTSHFYCLSSTLQRQLTTFFLCAEGSRAFGTSDVVLMICDYIVTRPHETVVFYIDVHWLKVESFAAILASWSVWSRQQVVAFTSTCTALWEVRETFFRSLHSKIAAPSRPYVSLYLKNYYNDHVVERPEEYLYKKKYAHMCFERGMESLSSVLSAGDSAASAPGIGALKLLRIASNLGHCGASAKLETHSLAKHLGVTDLLRIENPSAIVQNMIGDYYYALDNYDKAIKYYRPSAERGFHSSQYRYGNMLGWGEACETNEELAYEYHSFAASQGNSLAVERLSVYTENGWGVVTSADEAKRLMQVAAQMGNPAAMVKHANSLLVVSDEKLTDDSKGNHYRAFLQYSRSAALGFDGGVELRDRMLRESPTLCLPLGVQRKMWTLHFYCFPSIMQKQLVTFFLCAEQCGAFGARDMVLMICDYIVTRPLGDIVVGKGLGPLGKVVAAVAAAKEVAPETRLEDVLQDDDALCIGGASEVGDDMPRLSHFE